MPELSGLTVPGMGSTMVLTGLMGLGMGLGMVLKTTFRITPPPSSAITRPSSCVQKKAPVRLTSSNRRQSHSSSRSKGHSSGPALAALTSSEIRPNWSRARSIRLAA